MAGSLKLVPLLRDEPIATERAVHEPTSDAMLKHANNEVAHER